MRKRLAKYLELISQGRVSSFEVESRADEDAICNFRIISKIRNSGLFGNLKIMEARLMCTLVLWRSNSACTIKHFVRTQLIN